MERQLRKTLKGGVFKNVSPTRSKTMAAIRGKHNRSTEQRFKMLLVRNKISGWTSHKKTMPGNPDFFFAKENVAVFVDGCFWHGCPKCGHIPKTRTAFWEAKIQSNQERDKIKILELKKMGIKSLRIWEHELKDRKRLESVILKIKKAVKQ